MSDIKKENIFRENLIKFLNERKLIIKYDMSSYKSCDVIVPQCEKHKSTPDYKIDDYFLTKDNKLGGKFILPSFVEYLSKNKKPNDKIIAFINKKLPLEDKYGTNYTTYTKKLIESLRHNQSLLYDFISQNKFIISHYEEMNIIFKNIMLDKKYRTQLINKLVDSNLISSLKFQQTIYPLIKDYHDNPESVYPKLTEIILDKENITDLFVIKQEKSITFTFNQSNLVSFNLDKVNHISSSYLFILNISKNLLPYKKILGFDKIVEDEYKKGIITFIGENPRKEIISPLYQDKIKKWLSNDISSYSASIITQEEIDKYILEASLNNELQINTKRMKI